MEHLPAGLGAQCDMVAVLDRPVQDLRKVDAIRSDDNPAQVAAEEMVQTNVVAMSGGGQAHEMVLTGG